MNTMPQENTRVMDRQQTGKVLTFSSKGDLTGNFREQAMDLKLSDGTKLYLFGDVYYYMEDATGQVKIHKFILI